MNNSTQKTIYIIGKILAILLSVTIISGIVQGALALFNVIINKNGKSLKFNVNYDGNISIPDGEALVLNIGAAVIEINHGESFSYSANNDYIKVEETNDKIIVREENHNLINNYDEKLTLTLPEDKKFDTIIIKLGAGQIKADSLTANKADIELGAGEIIIGEFNANDRAEFEIGAGSLEIKKGTINNGEIENGAGSVNITAKVTGKFNAETGLGSCNLNVNGNIEDYAVEISKGLGEITLNGSKIDNDTVIGNGSNKIEIDGGIGDFNVSISSES